MLDRSERSRFPDETLTASIQEAAAEAHRSETGVEFRRFEDSEGSCWEVRAERTRIDGLRTVVVLCLRVGPSRPASTQVLRSEYRLTAREVEVCLMLADRYSTREIAGALSVRLNTARRHCESVVAKLPVMSRGEVRRFLDEMTG